MGATLEITEFITSLNYKSFPSEVVEVTKNAFKDTLAVAIAGSREEGSRILLQYVISESAAPKATVWSYGIKSSASLSALVNGAMAHALDLDDLSSVCQGHPSVAIIPAVLAAAEEVGSSGQDTIAAYVAGFEVMAYLGKLLGVNHYNRGWHGTSTMGVFGATAAAGKLYGLNTLQLRNALGLAASHCSGMRQNFGTMTKPYHPGHAARTGIMSALLAKAGFTADQDIVESPLGLLHLYGDGQAANGEKIGDTFELLHTSLTLKKYPCCFVTHRPIDAMFQLCQKRLIKAEEIQVIEVFGPKGLFAPVIHSRPKTGLEGKFSVEYCIAAVLLDGKVGIDTFTDTMVQRPSAQALISKVEKYDNLNIPIRFSTIDEGYIILRIKLKDNSVLEEKLEFPKGSPMWPLTSEELNEKYRDCASRFLQPDKVEFTIRLLDNLEELVDVQELLSNVF